MTRKNPPAGRASIAIDMNGLRNEGQKARALYDFSQPRAERPARSSQMELGDALLQREDKADNIRHSLSYAETPCPDTHPEPNEARDIAQQVQCQAEPSRPESRSATPYSWSKSESSKTRLERAVHRRLLEILHTGLSSVQNPGAENPGHIQKEYCDLHELKAILNGRKAHWQTEDSSSNSGCLREKSLEANAKDEKDIGTLPDLTPEVIPSSGRALPPKSSFVEDSPRHSFDFHDYDRAPPVVSSYDGAQLGQLHDGMAMEAEVEDDEAFFRKLDEAFHEIMSPGSKDTQPDGERPDRKAASLHRESVASILSDHLGCNIPYPKPVPIASHSTEKPARRPGGHCGSPKWPSNPGCPDQNGDNLYLTQPKQPLSASTKSVDHETRVIPQGFWRRNRLH